MRVVVDTPVWSLALRRLGRELTSGENDTVAALRELLAEGRCLLAGPVRQELLQGIRKKEQFDLLRRDLEELPDEPLWTTDYARAAQMFNQCRARGVQAASTDMLICSLAERLKAAVFTLDRDFLSYSRVLGTKLFKPVLH